MKYALTVLAWHVLGLAGTGHATASPSIASVGRYAEVRGIRMEYYVIESSKPKMQGFDGAALSFVQYLYELAK